ncbi:MAG: cyclic pyranopterin monophosphate synthase MoaC [Bacteroidales bacterium]|nr:cyclic pyranopterin monophosphate synthase MoaC [Bacteroidales bacterium]MCF8333960.1 cyclic pyranopterin monophosphate synthase MoaC [Bacteroidales bacterium]
MAKKFSHTDETGSARMVDVSEKPGQIRTASATGKIMLNDETIRLIDENNMKKGDVLKMAEFAGIQAAKKTSDLIPLCHPLPVMKIAVQPTLLKDGVQMDAQVKYAGKTGVEMEALTAVQVGLLTVYDMCKAVDKDMVITEVKLVSKTKQDYDDA